jgi:hypothetical protein
MNSQNSKPINIVSDSGIFSLGDYMNFLDECVAFEESFKPLIKEFEDYLLSNGKSSAQVKHISSVCHDFIYFNSTKLGKKELIDISKAEACSKFNQFSNKGLMDSYRKIDYADNMKLFFTFLHQNKNITNIKVLKAFYSKAELKELGIK